MMKTKLLKKLRKRFLTHIKSTIPPGKIYCYDRKYRYDGAIIINGSFIEALHDYYRAAINYYKYVNPPVVLRINKIIRQYKANKNAKSEALHKYKIYYEQ